MASNNSQNKNQMFQTIGGIVSDVTTLFNKNNNLTGEKLVKMVQKATVGLSKTAVNNRIKTALNVLDGCIRQQVNEAKRLARCEKQRAYYAANRDSIRAYQKEYMKSNRDLYERQLEASRNWKARNRERVLEYQRQYNANKRAEQQRQLEEQQAKKNSKQTSKKVQSKKSKTTNLNMELVTKDFNGRKATFTKYTNASTNEVMYSDFDGNNYSPKEFDNLKLDAKTLKFKVQSKKNK